MKTWIFNGGTLVSKEIFGVQRNTYEILKELDSMVKNECIEVVIPDNGKRELTFKNIKVVKLKHTSKFLWNHFVFPLYVTKHKGLGIDTILALPLWGVRVVSIYDCIAELFPQNASSIREKISRGFYIFRVKISLKKKRLILTDSKSAKKDISRLYNYPSKGIHVIYCGWQHMKDVTPEYGIIEKLGLKDKEFFFSLGSRYTHKNFKWIHEAAKKNPQYTFVSSGSTQLNTSDNSIDEEKLENLIFAGYLSDGEVKALMEKCKCFLQPSLYEGFGIPPMEAMSCGTDCIVSSTSSLPEVYGDSVWYIDPQNYDDINLDVIISKPKEDKKKVLDKYSWKLAAIQLKKIISEIDK